jgi:thioredoxin 1
MARLGRLRVAAVPSAALFLGLVAWLTACVQAEPPGANAAQVRAALASGRPTLIDLGARHCVSCKRMAPILESLAATYQGKANVLFVDIETDLDTARSLGLQLIPNQVFFDAQGTEVKRHIGFMEAAALVDGLKALGAE